MAGDVGPVQQAKAQWGASAASSVAILLPVVIAPLFRPDGVLVYVESLLDALKEATIADVPNDADISRLSDCRVRLGGMQKSLLEYAVALHRKKRICSTCFAPLYR